MPPLIATNPTDAVILYVAFFIWFLPEVLPAFKGRVHPEATTHDRFSGPFLIACIWLGVFLSNWFAFAQSGFAMAGDRQLLFAVGIFLILAGTAFRRYAILVLGRYFTRVITIQPGQTVVQAGPYRWIRHPSYTGALLSLFGVGLAFTNWLSLIGILALAVLGYSYRIHVEEMTLVSALGDPYREYMKHTKRIIPFVI